MMHASLFVNIFLSMTSKHWIDSLIGLRIYTLLVCVALFACGLLQLMAMLVRNSFVSLCFSCNQNHLNDMETAKFIDGRFCVLQLIGHCGTVGTSSFIF